MSEGVLKFWGAQLVKCVDPAVLSALPSGAALFLRDIGIPQPDRLDLRVALSVRSDGSVVLYQVSGLPDLTWRIFPGSERVMQVEDGSGETCVVNSCVKRMAEFLTISEMLRDEQRVRDVETARQLAGAALDSESRALAGAFHFWVEWFDVYFEEAEAFGWHSPSNAL